MKTSFRLMVSLLSLSLVSAAIGQEPIAGKATPPVVIRSAAVAHYGKLSLSFEVNQGQSDPKVKFVSRGNGYSLFLTDSAAVLNLTRSGAAGKYKTPAVASSSKVALADRNAFQMDVLRMEVAGASHTVQVSGEEKLPGAANYFIGSDPAKWHVNLPTYARVKYSTIYPGIDLIYYGNQRQLEYDFVIAPGANPKPISLHFAGAKKLTLTAGGDLTIANRNGDVLFHKPTIYQVQDGQHKLVEGSFRVLANNHVSFRLGSYDHSRELVIDPVLAYSTYLGGGSGTSGNAIAVDASGNAYIAGSASGPGLPTIKGAIESTPHSSFTAFVSKLNAAGDALLYSTYLGGSNYDFANSIAVDAAGDAYVTGAATSTNFPITGSAYQKKNNGAGLGVTNAFLAKLNPAGSSLVYSTYLGGSGSEYDSGMTPVTDGDQGTAVAVDASGDAYVTGLAYSYDFPVSKTAFQATNNEEMGSSCVFVTRFNSAGTGIVYSTYLGGSYYEGQNVRTRSRTHQQSMQRARPLTVTGGDQYPNPQVGGDDGYGIAVDNVGDAYVSGFAQTADFPTTPGAYQTSLGNALSGAFATKLNPAGSALIYSTVLAGSCYDGATGIAVYGSGDAYLTGAAGSYDFPTTTGAFQRVNKANSAASGCQSGSAVYNAFVSKLNPAGSALVFSTLLGGSVGDQSEGIALDASGNSYVTGYAGSPDFPLTADAFQRADKTSNGFVTEVNATGSALLYSTLIGGAGGAVSGYSPTSPNSIAIDKTDSVYITGLTSSVNFPVTSKPLQAGLENENYNAFVSKFAFGQKDIATALALSSSANPQEAGKPLTITVKVKPLSGHGIPSGTVSSSTSGSAPVTETLDSSGSASFLYSDPASGIDTIVASYSGDSSYAPTSGDLQQVVSGGAGSIAPYTSCGATYGALNQCQLVAVVEDVFGAPLPDAVVHFSSSGLRFATATATTNASGEATIRATATRTGQVVADATVEGVSYPAVFNITATPALLTVTATSITVVQGQPIPALGYSFTGFVNGDKSTVVTGAAGETTTATQGSPAGTYPITLTQGTLTTKNYTFKLKNGTVTITPQ